MDWDRKWLVDFNARKTQFVLFDRFCNTEAINVKKMDWSVLEEKSSFKMLGFSFSSTLDWGSYKISMAKTASRKLGALTRFSLLRLLCISLNLSYGLAWNTVVMSGLVLLAATWKC